MGGYLETKEIEHPDAIVKLSSVDELSAEQDHEVMDLLRIGYAERWQGEDNYRNSIANNATELLRIYLGSSLSAALFLDHKRITAISVHPTFRGNGLGTRLFEEATKAQPDVWISAGVDAQEMMITLTGRKLGFLPVGDKADIESMYRETNQGRNAFEVEAESLEIPFLSDRLRVKGVSQDIFTAYTRSLGTHRGVYQQVLFQNHLN